MQLKGGKMVKYIQKEAEIKQAMPRVKVSAISFYPYDNEKLYVNMNIKSYVLSLEENIDLCNVFLFEVKYAGFSQINKSSKQDSSEILDSLLAIKISPTSCPEITLVNSGYFPKLFHPHFSISLNHQNEKIDKISWVDYREEITEKDVGSYILRVARSLKYEKGFIDTEAKSIGNSAALRWYSEENSKKFQFPTDDIQIPTAKTFKIASRNENNQQLTQLNPPRRNVKFEIKESHPPYLPKDKNQPDFLVDGKLNSDYRNDELGSLTHQFYLTKTAFDAIAQHIEWGRRTEQNIVEQGGILLGEVFRDPQTKITYAVAEHAIPGRSARGTPGYIEMTHETWKEMYDHADRLNTELPIIGWYHTHPNSLDVFMSGTDRATQARVFKHDWQFAIVLNPHKTIWRAFYGENSSECRGYVLD
jgi:proteasome lid subunit RPN8/RPN11